MHPLCACFVYLQFHMAWMTHDPSCDSASPAYHRANSCWPSKDASSLQHLEDCWLCAVLEFPS